MIAAFQYSETRKHAAWQCFSHFPGGSSSLSSDFFSLERNARLFFGIKAEPETTKAPIRTQPVTDTGSDSVRKLLAARYAVSKPPTQLHAALVEKLCEVLDWKAPYLSYKAEQDLKVKAGTVYSFIARVHQSSLPFASLTINFQFRIIAGGFMKSDNSMWIRVMLLWQTPSRDRTYQEVSYITGTVGEFAKLRSKKSSLDTL